MRDMCRTVVNVYRKLSIVAILACNSQPFPLVYKVSSFKGVLTLYLPEDLKYLEVSW